MINYYIDASDGAIVFSWEGETYRKPKDVQFPVVIQWNADRSLYSIRTAMTRDHKHRVRLVQQGKWRRRYQIGRKSPLKFWLFELTHAMKNVLVEEARRRGIINRGNRNPNKPDGYVFPAGKVSRNA
jgi:hypothetical protein